VICFYGRKGCARTSHAHECCAQFIEQLKEERTTFALEAQVMDDDDLWSLSCSSADDDDAVNSVFHERRSHYQDCSLVVSLSTRVGSVTVVDMVPSDSGTEEFLSMLSAVKQFSEGPHKRAYETSQPLCSVIFRKLTLAMPQLLFVGVVAPQRAAAESWQTLQFTSRVRNFVQLKSIEQVPVDSVE
jgi:hypothetical protein